MRFDNYFVITWIALGIVFEVRFKQTSHWQREKALSLKDRKPECPAFPHDVRPMSQRHIRISIHLKFTRFMKLNLGAEHLCQVPELGHYKSQARGQAGWILAKLSFCVFMVRDESSWPLKIHAAIYISSPISSYLDRNSLDNNGSILRHSRLHVAFRFHFCVCRKNVFLKLNNIFVFFVFILVDAFKFLVF